MFMTLSKYMRMNKYRNKATHIEIYWIELLNDNPIFLPTRGFIWDLGEYTTGKSMICRVLQWWITITVLHLNTYYIQILLLFSDTLFKMNWCLNRFLIDNTFISYIIILFKKILNMYKINEIQEIYRCIIRIM